MSKKIGACTRHLKWTPCLGRHTRYDGEPCAITRDARAIAIMRSFHGGTLTLEAAYAAIGNLNIKPKVVDNRQEVC